MYNIIVVILSEVSTILLRFGILLFQNFYLETFLFFLMLLSLFFLLRINRLRYIKNRELKERQKEIEAKNEELELKNKELEVAKTKSEEASKAKELFLSAMSHEIRTPMNAVVGLTNYLIEDNPMEHQLESLKALKFSAQNLMVLLNDILDFSKIEAQKMELEFVTFSILELISHLESGLKTKAEEKGLYLNVVLDEKINEFIIGDPTRLSQILNNLIDNAIKFTNRGGVELRIEHLKGLGDKVILRFKVVDTGIGIESEKLEHIFGLFTQGRSDITRKYGGTGLGLAITRRLLELQNSQIYVDSKVGEGTTFWFDLEFGEGSKEELNKNREDEVKNIEQLDNVKILMVEDNKVNQLVANKFLNKWGAVVEVAENGLEGVKMATKNKYDLILMDLQMPEMDGYTAATEIRKFNDRIPIIALTASAMINVKIRVFGAGMNDFVVKPFNPVEFNHKIHRNLKRSS